MRTSPVPFSFSGIEVIAGMFGGGAVCAKLRVPPSAVMPAAAQAARPRKRRRLWSDVVMATFLIKGYVSCSPAPDPENGVGIHHSSPRAVEMYSGHRRSTGGTKSRGSNGATHLVPPTPPPVR